MTVKKPCRHTNLIIYEQIIGKRTFTQKPFSEVIDWKSNIINGHILRVSKYMCVNCNEIIPAPSDAED